MLATARAAATTDTAPRPDAAPADRADRAHRIAFSHVPGVGPARLQSLLDTFGSAEAAWRAPAPALAPILDQRTLGSLLKTRAQTTPEALTRRLDDLGIQAILREDPAYPQRLRRHAGAPCVLYVIGAARWLDTPSVAVVGTRRATAYGRQATARIVADLAAAGLTIVSGLALGIDTAAHAAAVEAGGATVAVLGCGVDVVYPRANEALRARIAEHGALVSEFPPGCPPDAGNFPSRNRIVAGLALATVVVEAGEQSGALITAGQALDQGSDVFAVPGSIFGPQSVGTHRLLADGAAIARSAADILAGLDVERAAAQRAAREALPASPLQAAILTQLAGEPMHIDEIGRALGVSSATLSSTLMRMEVTGMVQAVGGQRWMAGP